MMSVEAIIDLENQAARKAKRQGAQPYVFAPGTGPLVDGSFPAPNLGSYVPEGWEEVERHFVDKTGWGSPGEPALTIAEFIDVVNERVRDQDFPQDLGWAIVSEGQFQIFIGEFRRKFIAG